LWASSAFYTNDVSEIEYGVNLVCRIASELAPTGEIERAFGRPEKSNEDVILSLFEDSYVACFCADPDLLSQWRAYAASGAGYSIGFKREAISVAGSQCGFDLVPVTYDLNAQEETIRTFLRRAQQTHPSLDGNDSLRFWFRAVRDAVELAMCFKHKSFEGELEWRLITAHPRLETKYRAGRWGFIPFVEIPFEKECVSEIRQGPALAHKRAQYTLQSYLARTYGLRADGSPKVQVHRSAIPFRTP
jgi:hypothetical protein